MTDKCQIWKGPRWSNGRYGLDYINDRPTGAHRAAWIRENGEIPKGLFVCHKCDNGLCVNVNHLFLGTPKINMQDCKNKGRLGRSCQKGQNNANAKPGLVARNSQILKDRKKGLTYSEIKEKHSLKSNGHLRNILKSFGL